MDAGFWLTNATEEVEYIPQAPPKTLEPVSAPPIETAPAVDYVWAPGCWVCAGDRYAWRPGYRMQPRAGWVWVPPTYIRTRHGYIYVEGYWDYAVEDRGVIFAPAYIHRTVYTRPAFVYTPTIVIETNVITPACSSGRATTTIFRRLLRRQLRAPGLLPVVRLSPASSRLRPDLRARKMAPPRR